MGNFGEAAELLRRSKLMIEAILFDLDGTLLDTIPDIQHCVNAVLAAHGYPALDRARICAYVGDGARRLIERALPAGAADVEACYNAFRTLFAACDNAHTTLYPHAKEVLCACKAAGYRLGVVTNKPQDAAQRVLAQFFPQQFFDFIGGDSGAFPCKPHPALALHAARALGVAPAQCAFVGDGEPDAQVAQNAGMFGISALWGYRTRAQLTAAGATAFAEDFLQLKKFFQKLC